MRGQGYTQWANGVQDTQAPNVNRATIQSNTTTGKPEFNPENGTGTTSSGLSFSIAPSNT